MGLRGAQSADAADAHAAARGRVLVLDIFRGPQERRVARGGRGSTRAKRPRGGDGGYGRAECPGADSAPGIAPGGLRPYPKPRLSREQHAYCVPGLIPAVLAQAAVARGTPFAGAAAMVRLVGAHLQPAFGRAPLALLLKAVHRLVQGAPCGEDGRWRPLGGDLAAAGFEHRPKILPLTICHENRRARRAPFAHRPLETDHGRRSPPADWTGRAVGRSRQGPNERSDLGLPRFGD